jgi:hypothetical protein
MIPKLSKGNFFTTCYEITAIFWNVLKIQILFHNFFDI